MLCILFYVWVFWEGLKIWKNLCRTFDKSIVFCAHNSVLVKKSTKIFQNKCGQVLLYKLYNFRQIDIMMISRYLWIIHFLFLGPYAFTDVHYEPSMMWQGKTPGGSFIFCGGILPGKTPQVSINIFWGVFPGEMPPQTL